MDALLECAPCHWKLAALSGALLWHAAASGAVGYAMQALLPARLYMPIALFAALARAAVGVALRAAFRRVAVWRWSTPPAAQASPEHAPLQGVTMRRPRTALNVPPPTCGESMIHPKVSDTNLVT
jgi:hypothetical protein